MVVISRKRKRGQFTSSTFLRYRQTPNNLKRVKAHATKRELQLSFLIVSANWRFSGTRI